MCTKCSVTGIVEEKMDKVFGPCTSDERIKICTAIALTYGVIKKVPVTPQEMASLMGQIIDLTIEEQNEVDKYFSH